MELNKYKSEILSMFLSSGATALTQEIIHGFVYVVTVPIAGALTALAVHFVKKWLEKNYPIR